MQEPREQGRAPGRARPAGAGQGEEAAPRLRWEHRRLQQQHQQPGTPTTERRRCNQAKKSARRSGPSTRHRQRNKETADRES